MAAFAGPALADGGYFAGNLGAKASGRSGAFAARADDLSAISYNPAGLAKLDRLIIQVGNQTSYNGYVFTRAPTTDYGKSDAPRVTFGKVNNGVPTQALVPMLGVASNLGFKDWGFALAMYAPPGTSKLSFPQDGGQRYSMVSREVMLLKYVASAAWKFKDVFGVGATAEWIHVPRLKYSLVIDGSPLSQAANPVSSNYDILANLKGSSLFTFNAILGAWYRPVPYLEFGLSGQVVPANIKVKANLDVEGLTKDVSEVWLERNSNPATDVTVTLPLPMLARAGARYRHLSGDRELFDIELDVEYVTWSRVKRFTVDTNGLTAMVPPFDYEIKQIKLEKQWRDTIAVRLGGDYAVIPDLLTLRGGGFFESAVAAPAYTSVEFSTAAQFGGSLGASVFYKNFEFALAYIFRIQPSVSISEANARGYQQAVASSCEYPYKDSPPCNEHYLGQPSPAVNAGTYSASSHFLTLDAVYRY
jgi:long-subunit fatty acid transport protein